MSGRTANLTVSIVLYHNHAMEIKGLISCILKSDLIIRIYLIDNSDTDELKRLATDDRIEYVFNNKNYGYGRGHNIAICKSLEIGSPYHLVLNPDVEFEGEILRKMFDFMQSHREAGCAVPNILYPNGKKQYLYKLYPTPFDLVMRRFLPDKVSNAIPRLDKYELRHLNRVQPVPIASGCFLFCRNSVLKEIGGFDERYFMYLEDFDLSRRINAISKVIFLPCVNVIHGYAKGSYTKPKLLLYHIVSAIKYFNKWGWLFDRERKSVNKKYKKII